MSAQSRRQVAILGTATSTLEQAPVGDAAWEIWACSSWMENKLPQFDRFYELHSRQAIEQEGCKTYLKWLEESGKPVYVFDDLGLSNQVFYPRKEVEDHLTGRGFYTSTIAWMQAHAVFERVSKIGIWGVDMAGDHEYAHQKAGCLHFISVARMVGIEVVLPVDSELHKVPAAYPDDSPVRLEVTRLLEGVEATVKEIDKALSDLRDDKLRALAQVDALRMLLRTVI